MPSRPARTEKEKLAWAIWRAKHPDYRSDSKSENHPSVMDYRNGTVLVALLHEPIESLRAMAAKNRVDEFRNGRFIGKRENPSGPRRASRVAKKAGRRKKNPLYAPAGFTDPDKYTVGFGFPKDLRGTVPNVDPQGTDLSIWTWTSAGAPYAIAFAGRSGKPLWYHRFRTVEQRAEHIRDAIRSRKASLQYKEEREEKKRVERSTPHNVKVGQIFVATWGYSMTLADFYQVVALAGKSSAVVREIAAERVPGSSDRGGGERLMPVPGKFVGSEKRVLLRGGGFMVEKHRARPWDGKSVYINTYD